MGSPELATHHDKAAECIGLQEHADCAFMVPRTCGCLHSHVPDRWDSSHKLQLSRHWGHTQVCVRRPSGSWRHSLTLVHHCLQGGLAGLQPPAGRS